MMREAFSFFAIYGITRLVDRITVLTSRLQFFLFRSLEGPMYSGVFKFFSTQNWVPQLIIGLGRVIYYSFQSFFRHDSNNF